MKKTPEKLINVQKRKFETKRNPKTGLAVLGMFVNIIWVLGAFIRPLVAPIFLVTLGGVSLLITTGGRLQSRNFKSKVAGEVSGGSIIGYVFSLILVLLGYPVEKNGIILSPGTAFTVNQVLIFYLTAIFFVWFLIPADEVSSETIFGFPPLVSYLILNFWKLAVILEVLTLLEELRPLGPSISAIFLLLGYLELIIQYFRVYNLQIADIILDPVQLIFKTLEGPLNTLKWSFLVIIFLILDTLPLDLLSAGLIAFSLLTGMISLSTVVTKTILNSGFISSKVDGIAEESKVLIPKMFEELKQIEADDLQEFYRVTERISVRKKNDTVNYSKGDILFKMPFTETLQKQAGVYLVNLRYSKRRSSPRIAKKQQKNGSTVHFQTLSKSVTAQGKNKTRNLDISSIKRITIENWQEIMKRNQLEPVEKTVIANELGYDSPEEFEKVIEKGIQGATSIQENIRDRIRGVPVITSAGDSKIVKLRNKQVKIPDEIVEKFNLKEDQEIELIPGKDEFLFYVKLKKKEDV